jgi:tetraacyldisaccharide 4'-kinase
MKLRSSIESIIFGNGQEAAWPLRSTLSAASLLYGGIQLLRATLYRRGYLRSVHPAGRIISIGNLVLGGTGKTPMTCYLARILTDHGLKVAIVSRGYGGGAQRAGGVVSDGMQTLMSARQAGDEPFLMAQQLPGIPVLVGRRRANACRLAIRHFAAEVLLLDDGFQHLKVRRDLNLVLMDYHRPMGNRHLFPRGPLREPVSALRRCDAVVLTRCESRRSPKAPAEELNLAARPVFRAYHRQVVRQVIPAGSWLPVSLAWTGKPVPPGRILAGRQIYLFSGLADNRAFHESVVSVCGRVAGIAEFSDHHWFRSHELEQIRQAALAGGADMIVTTDKDFARISDSRPWPLDLAVMGVEITFSDDAFDGFIRNWSGKVALPADHQTESLAVRPSSLRQARK